MSPDLDPKLTTRRDFIRQASCAAVGTLALKSTIRDLRLINRAVAQTGLTGYKALVCLFLSGGNDANNWIIPTDTTTYNNYAAIRGNLTLPKASLLPLRLGINASDTVFTDGDGHTYGFHPGCDKLQTLFGDGKLTPVFNIGTLVRPTTRAQYTGSTSSSYQPPQLFSHSDQVTQWQTSIPDQPPLTGWGGRVADILNVANPTGKISMSVSLNGANTFEVGNLISQYQVSTTGAVTMSGNLMTGTGARVRALRDILAINTSTSTPNLQQRAYADTVERAVFTGDLLNTAIATEPNWTTPFPTSSLGTQLRMIARMIDARGPSKFDMNRQVFFCSTGGFDTHTAQVLATTAPNTGQNVPEDPSGSHYKLLKDISDCMYAFQKAMEQLVMSDSVTTFTASDFSRTLPTNSQGSDHGWGSHHMVMGGAVNGRQTYGKLPTFAVNGPDDTGLGRWIPTLAVDQHSATLAKWFGVDTSKMADIFPNLSRFSTSNLGFMA